MILRARNLTKKYPGPPATQVLKDVSLTLDAGESLAIRGRSGEGKTTLLHILGTLESPTSGSIEILSQPAHSGQRLHEIGFIFQSFYLLEDLSVLENVLLPLRIARRPASSSHGLALLEEVGMQEKASLRACYLSGGEKQRVAIARALCNQPSLLLADEPTGNLDHFYSQQIQDLLLSAVKRRGASLIVATHDPEFASKCDRQLFLKEGLLSTE